MAKPILTLERLKELLSYNPEDGTFTWLVSTRGKVRAGAIAGSFGGYGGKYRTIHIGGLRDGRKYYAHRLAWLWMTGKWPEATIDHIDGNPDNNRFANLRDISIAANLQNKRLPRKTGLLGAHYDARYNNWVAHIQINYHQRHLGCFSTEEEAHAAYIAAKRALHPFGTL